MEAVPIDYTTIIGSVGGFLGFLITMIVVVVNMQQNSRYQNKNMEKLTLISSDTKVFMRFYEKMLTT